MSRRAFTLVELLVVVAIIGLLSTVAVVSLNSSRINARNTKRKADLIQISKALELYYSDNGGYPSTASGGGYPGGSGFWRGNCATAGSFPDSGDGAWIPGFQNYMEQLPHDQNTGKVNLSSADSLCQTVAGWSCYIYTSDGINYKLLAHCTPEGTMSAADPFYDPLRPGKAWQVTNNSPVTNSW